MPYEMLPPNQEGIRVDITVDGTDQAGRRVTEWAYAPFYENLQELRGIFDGWLRRDSEREVLRQMYQHQREINREDHARGFDGRFAYSDLAHGQWGRFFLDLGLRYEYLSPTRAASPGFIVYHAPGGPTAWYIGTFAARTIAPSALQEIGQLAVARDMPAFLTLGQVDARAIIGIIPQAAGILDDFACLMPNGVWPTARVVGQQPFHIVMGYQFAACPRCHAKVLALPSSVYAASGLLTTVAHGACPAYVTPRDNGGVHMAMTNALLTTELIRHQESYLFGSMPPR